MRFELQPGERTLAEAELDLVENRRTYPATLILTSHRAVLTYAKTPPVWLWAFAWWIAAAKKAVAHAQQHVRHQIRRDRFASVEQGEGRILVFHDSGEGYAHTSFAVQSHTSLAQWQERMKRWADGADDANADDAHDNADTERPAQLPSAHTVKR